MNYKTYLAYHQCKKKTNQTVMSKKGVKDNNNYTSYMKNSKMMSTLISKKHKK